MENMQKKTEDSDIELKKLKQTLREKKHLKKSNLSNLYNKRPP